MKERFSPTERIGVTAVEAMFLNMGWIPRQILQSDVGVDMEVEICVEGNPTGKLFALQIKTGESYFEEQKDGNIVYRGSPDHLDYWLNHSLPIIIVLVNPKTEALIWQNVTEDLVTRTKKGWKIDIPLKKKLNKDVKEEIEELNKLPLYLQRFQRLMLQKELIKKVADEFCIVAEVDHWCNKSIGRATITILQQDFFGAETELSTSEYIFFIPVSSLYQLFPWAAFSNDDEYFEQYNDEEPGNNDISESEGFSCIQDGSGEIQTYRLIFSLNELGKTFVKMDELLENEQ